jgi:hypothetical protein
LEAGGRVYRRRCRGGHDDGASLVEFAIILPLVCLMLFGIIEFGKGYNDYQSLRQGVREAARAGSVDQYRGYSLTTLPSDHVPIATCSPGTDPIAVQRLRCLTKHESGIGPNLRVRIQYTAPVGAPDPTDKGAVKVCAQRPFEPVTGFIPGLTGITFKTEIEMRMEKALPAVIAAAAAANGGTVTYSEAAPAGGSWSWC